MRALACLLALAPLVGTAQPAVERPDVAVGDRWTYQRMDYDAGQPRGRFELEVVFAERGVIQVVGTSKRTDDEVDTTYTADWNAVSTAVRVFYPHTGWLRFPLQVGDRYSTGFDAVMLKRKVKARNEREVTVVGWEEVEVPAGRFRALKVVSEGRFERQDATRISGTSRNVIWYVPQVKRWVKRTVENRPSGPKARGKGEHVGEELVDYKVR